MNKDSNSLINFDSIRRNYSNETNSWLYSIVDIIAIVSKSSDPRNYWKVLKSRLNKANPQLVTGCNQLKMPSSDGKMYFTDVADAETLLDIIKVISPTYVRQFNHWFDNIQSENISNSTQTATNDDAELTIDAYESNKEIVVQSLIAGVSPENLTISVDCNNINIRGKRLLGETVPEENYSIQELYWGTFSRTIPLPEEIDIDETEATISHGLLKIKLPKINKLRTRIIKIKSQS